MVENKDEWRCCDERIVKVRVVWGCCEYGMVIGCGDEENDVT